MASRSIFNGTIAFGLVNVPVKVHSATEDKSIHFHEVHAKDGARIEHRRICPEHGEVPYEEVAKGFQVGTDEYVVLSQEEIAAAAGERSKTIEIDEFVCAEDIDPLFYERTYYLGAGEKGDGEAAYRLLHDALGKAGRAGIGRWVFHNREYLVAIRPLDGVLAMHTMRFHDELVPEKDLDVRAPRRKPSKREVDMAEALVESLHAEFDAAGYEDTYRKAVMKVIRAKAKGREIEVPEPPEPEETGDLLAALEAAIAEKGKVKRKRKGGGSRKNTRRRTKAKA